MNAFLRRDLGEPRFLLGSELYFREASVEAASCSVTIVWCRWAVTQRKGPMIGDRPMLARSAKARYLLRILTDKD